jgi:hypothetical protein
MVHFGWCKSNVELNSFGTTKAVNPVLQICFNMESVV